MTAAGLGERLRAARERAGMTQTQLAEAVGYVSRGAVHNWETGRQTPPVETIEKLADALGVGAGWLAFGGKE